MKDVRAETGYNAGATNSNATQGQADDKEQTGPDGQG